MIYFYDIWLYDILLTGRLDLPILFFLLFFLLKIKTAMHVLLLLLSAIFFST